MSEGYFTIVGGDLDDQHRYIGEDETELHHIPKQEIPADTNVHADSVNPTWKQEKYTLRLIEVDGFEIEFFGLSSWSDSDCILYVFFHYHHSRDHDEQET